APIARETGSGSKISRYRKGSGLSISGFLTAGERNSPMGQLLFGSGGSPSQMFWPILTIISVLAVVASQIWWRGRLRQAKADAQLALEKLQRAQTENSQQIQTQQEALFDSMAEGLLVLDDAARVQLANRAFHQLFG